MATIIGTNGNDTRTGTAADDTIIGLAGNDQLLGSGGNDRLIGGLGNDVLNGGAGIDTANYNNPIIGGTTYIGATSGVTVNLTLTGAQNTGGAGVDTLVSIENLIGTNFNDILTGNSANNVLSGLSGNDKLTGNAGNDILAGVAGTDQLLGGDGNDLLNGGTQNDVLNGGLGSDTADYGTFSIGGQNLIGATAGVTVNLNVQGVAQNTGGAGLDTLVSIENLTGSVYSDRLTGNSANNVLTGREGNDILMGGNGNDTLQGDSGNDTLNGGDGLDTASYTTATAAVTIDLNYYGSGQATGGAGIDTLVNIEDLTGSRFNDVLNSMFGTINGGDGDDRLSSSDGGATLNGGAGNDVLYAVEGSGYTLSGGAGNDVVTYLGLAGDNTINGGAGTDRLTHDAGAGGGPVTFDYNIVTDSPAGTGRDTITIIGPSGVPAMAGLPAGDQIDLRDIDANTLVSGNQAFQWKGATPGGAGTLWYAGGVLNGNVDGDAAAEFQIQLVGGPVLFVNPASAGTDILL
jgi:Ca2+-binding RTX toxin-like protein